MDKRLTIIGGTGHLSTRVVRRLVKRGMSLKLVARDPEKVRRLFGDMVDVVFGDVSDVDSLHTALQGSEVVYIHLNTETLGDQAFYTEREGVQNIVAAAEANGVSQLVQIAGIESLHPEFFTGGVLATEPIRRVGMDAVRASSIPHTFLMCSMFLDSLPRYVSDNVLAIFGEVANQIHFTNSNQLADHLHHVVGNTDAYNKSLPVQGLEALDFESGARRFFSVYDPDVMIERMPVEMIDQFGLPEDEAAFLKHIWDVTSGMTESFKADSVHQKFGAPTDSLESFAAELRTEVAA